MTEPLQVGQFGIVDHEPIDRSPNAGIFHGKGPAAERAELFVVAEGTTPAGEDFAGHVVSAVGHAWAHLDMSLTGATRRVFDEAERNVYDWNQKSIAQHRVQLGMTAFAHKGPHMVIAQAGPTVAFHLGGGRVTAYMPEGEAAVPIGAESRVQPSLTRIDFAPGDRLLVFSTAALAEVDQELIEGILNLPGVRALQDLYRRVEHIRHLTVLLIESPAVPEALPEDEEQGAPGRHDDDGPIIGGPGTRHARKALQPSLFVEALDEERHRAVREASEKLSHMPPRPGIQPVDIDNERDQIAPLRRAAGDTGLARLAAAQRERASESRLAAASAVAVAQSVHTLPSWRGAHAQNGHAHNDHSGHPAVASTGGQPQNADGGSRAMQDGASFTRSLVPQRVHPRPDPGVSDAPLASELAAAQRVEIGGPPPAHPSDSEAPSYGATPLVRPRSGMGRRWKGNGALSRRTMIARQAPSTRLVVGVGLALLLALVAFLALPRVLGTNDDARVAELLESGRQQLMAAQVQDDPGERRAALTEAQALALEADQLSGATTETQSLVNEVGAELARLDAIREPARVEVIGDLGSYGDAPVTPADVSVGPSVAFLLDTTSEQVVAQPLDGANPYTVYRADAEAGHGRPVAIAYWESGSGDDRLLIVDNQGAIWSSGADGAVLPVGVNLPDGTRIADIAISAGDLYILDADAGSVYRMTPLDGSFPYEPQVVQERESLANAVRLMVDGDIVTSSSDGVLQRYSGELSLELSQAGIDRRLAQAAAPWAMADGSIAVADLANDRVAVFHTDGTFVEQFRAPAFRDMASMGMRDGAGYVFAGGQLLRVTWRE